MVSHFEFKSLIILSAALKKSFSGKREIHKHNAGIFSDLFFFIFCYYSHLLIATAMVKLKGRFLCHGSLLEVLAGNARTHGILIQESGSSNCPSHSWVGWGSCLIS